MSKNVKKIQMRRLARARRIRAHIVGVSDRPRLSVFRSLKHITGAIIMPGGATVITVTDAHLEDKKTRGVARAFAVGKLLAERAREKKIESVVFDKGRYTYHGRIKALADGAREGGLQF